MVIYRSLSEFASDQGVETKMEWEKYCDRVTQYFLTNAISDSDDTQVERDRKLFFSSQSELKPIV